MNKEKLYIRKITTPYSDVVTYKLMNEKDETLTELCAEKEHPFNLFFYLPNCNENDKVLYITNFTTKKQYRNKGYGKYLLTKVINRYKGKYDMVHLNACPYHIKNDGTPIFEAPKNGLNENKLIEFYKNIGFEEKRKMLMHRTDKYTVMIMNLK